MTDFTVLESDGQNFIVWMRTSPCQPPSTKLTDVVHTILKNHFTKTL